MQIRTGSVGEMDFISYQTQINKVTRTHSHFELLFVMRLRQVGSLGVAI